MASVVCSYSCRQANLNDLPASKPTWADMIPRRQGYRTLLRRVSIGGRTSNKAASVDMVQSMIRPSRSIVLPPVPAMHWFWCFASSGQPHTFWKEGCGLVRRGRDCQTLSHHSYTHLADDIRTHLADDIRICTIPCRRSSPMMSARVQFSKTTHSTSQGIFRQVRSSALVNFQTLTC